MDLLESAESAARFSRYVAGLASVMGHADRSGPLGDYCLGLVLPGERKSVEPMAAVTAPSRVAAQHQSLLHFVGQAPWSDERVLAKVREMVLPDIERHGPIEAWIIDDTGYPKKGRHSVGVARQYLGQLGKQDNCQAAVSLSIANRQASLPVNYRLYLPKEWADDGGRRRKAGVPEDLVFKTKPQIALEQIAWACRTAIPKGVVLMDAGYGNNTALRMEIGALALTYVAGILSSTSVWAPGMMPLPPRRWSGRGRRPTRPRHSAKHKPVSAKQLALALPRSAWRTIGWREGTSEKLSSRFARLRVRTAHGSRLHDEEWLIIEWPKGEKEPTKYWLSTLPADITFERLVDLTKLRWRIERDYQELKQEFGLGHYEGRGWRGFHHHATLCIAAYGFLISEMESIPPSEPRAAASFSQPAIPAGYRPRGAADKTSASHSKLDRHPSATIDRHPRQKPATVSMLRPKNRPHHAPPFMTQ
jgi:SRSO17 transposase